MLSLRRPDRVLLLMLTLTVVVVCAQAQCTQKLSDLPGSPELMGFHLGMTKEEIKARIPQAAFGPTDDFGVSKTTINPSFDSKIDQTKFQSVRSISLDMLDNRLTSLWIGFDETFKTQSIDDFVLLISRELKVPENWSSWRSRGREIRCADFQLIITPIAGSPTLRVLDLGAEDIIAARRQTKEEEREAAEAAIKEEDQSEVTGDKAGKLYYPAGCHPPKEIPSANKIFFKSSEEAEKAGFKLADNCH